MLEVSRVKLLGYFQHLDKAKILNLLYSSEINIKKLQKPDKIFVENPNIMDAMTLDTVNEGTKRECFIVNQLRHRVEYTKQGDFLVDGRYTIEVGGKSKEGKQIAGIENAFLASDDIEYAYGNKIPLWHSASCTRPFTLTSRVCVACICYCSLGLELYFVGKWYCVEL